MKKIILIIFLLACSAGAAQAEVTGLTTKLKGGCHSANTEKGCTVGVVATGTDLASDSVILQHANGSHSRFRNVSAEPKTLSETGHAVFRFRNQSGCYRSVTSENGNDVPDIRSKPVCEK